MHDLPLLINIAICLTAALAFGFVTQRLGLSPIVGYLLAGIAVGPNTPGIVADIHIASELAEIGVILLMSLGLITFPPARPGCRKKSGAAGAIGQSIIAIALVIPRSDAGRETCRWPDSWALARFSSPAPWQLVRMLDDNKLLDTSEGHVAVGWLVVEDLFAVLVLVLLPTIANARLTQGEGHVLSALGVALGKLALLIVLLLVLGARVMPKLLSLAAATHSRELFTLHRRGLIGH